MTQPDPNNSENANNGITELREPQPAYQVGGGRAAREAQTAAPKAAPSIPKPTYNPPVYLRRGF